MTRTSKWLVGLGLVATLLGAAAVAIYAWVPTDEELAHQAEAKLEEALGVKVRIGALNWVLLPMPAVVLQDVATEQGQPITAKRVSAYLHLQPLLHRIISVESVKVEGAVVPQLSLRGFDADKKDDKKDARKTDAKDSAKDSTSDPQLPGNFQLAPIPLEHFHFTDVTWISRRGIPVVYDGDITFDTGWRPAKAQVRRPGVTPETQVTLTRQGQEDRWQVRATVGGGTLNGEARLKVAESGAMQLSGELLPKNIEIANAVQAFNRKPVISGRGSGSTVLEANGNSVGELTRSLHTRTQFTVAPASVIRFDLHKAIKTFGKEHDGQTPLESVTGLMDTQNTGQGTIFTYSGLKATSGQLTASGNVVIFSRRIEAQGAVDLVDGLIGVPIKVSGRMEKPDVSVPKGAIVGAAVGTAILPIIGTAIGARLGALFNGDGQAAKDDSLPPAGKASSTASTRKPPQPRPPRSP